MYSEQAETLLRMAKERGTPVPTAILDAPILEDSYQARVLDAFWKLSTCRQISDGMCGPIPWFALHQFAYANEFAADDIEFASFEYCVCAMDEAFLGFQSEEAKRNREAAKRKAKLDAGRQQRGGGRVG